MGIKSIPGELSYQEIMLNADNVVYYYNLGENRTDI